MISSVKNGKVETINTEAGSCHSKPAFEGKMGQIESKGTRERKMAPKCIFVNVYKDRFFSLTKMYEGQSLSHSKKEMVNAGKRGLVVT